MRHHRIYFTIAIYKSEDKKTTTNDYIEKNVCSWWMFRKCDEIKPRIFFNGCKRRARNWCIFICWRMFLRKWIFIRTETQINVTHFFLNQVSRASESHLCVFFFFWIIWYCIYKWKWKWKWNPFCKCSFVRIYSSYAWN